MEWGYDRSKENVAAGEAKMGLQEDDSCHDWATMKQYEKSLCSNGECFGDK